MMKMKTAKLITFGKGLAWINLMMAFYFTLMCALLGALSFFGIFEYKLFYINESDSAPHGVYMARFNIQSEDGSGARMELLVSDFYYLVSLPVDVPVLDKKAGFNLIKVCCGLPGTSYIVTDTELVMDGEHYPISNKTGLPHVKPGKYIVPKDTVLFLNDPDTSFDSRYLGPINRQYVKKALYYIGPTEKYIFWSKCYAVSLVISLYVYLSADSLKSFVLRRKNN